MKNIISTKILKSILVLVGLSLVLTSCGGGSCGLTAVCIKVKRGYTHAELARNFVSRLNSSNLGYNVRLEKTNTQQSNYIVVYDRDTNQYASYFIGNYRVGNNLSNYLNNHNGRFYFNVELVDGTTNMFRDSTSGTLFSISENNYKKDIGGLVFMKEQVAKLKTQEYFSQFGFSDEKASDVAELAVQFSKMPEDQWTLEEVNELTENIIGVSFSEIKSAAENKDYKKLGDIWMNSSKELGITPNQLQELTNSFLATSR